MLGTISFEMLALTEVVRCFEQSLQADTGIVLKVGHDRFLVHSLEFIIQCDQQSAQMTGSLTLTSVRTAQ